MAQSRHDQVAEQLAKKFRGVYNPDEGADVIAGDKVIEVETHNTLSDAVRQLQGYRKRVYVTPTSEKDLDRALQVTEGTTVGVMTPDGTIVKRSTRGQG